MKEKLKDVVYKKTGTNYLILRIPKSLFKQIPTKCFIDLEINDVRSSESTKKIKKKRKRK